MLDSGLVGGYMIGGDAISSFSGTVLTIRQNVSSRAINTTLIVRQRVTVAMATNIGLVLRQDVVLVSGIISTSAIIIRQGVSHYSIIDASITCRQDVHD
jgi:hypothetical protein